MCVNVMFHVIFFVYLIFFTIIYIKSSIFDQILFHVIFFIRHLLFSCHVCLFIFKIRVIFMLCKWYKVTRSLTHFNFFFYDHNLEKGRIDQIYDDIQTRHKYLLKTLRWLAMLLCQYLPIQQARYSEQRKRDFLLSPFTN